MAAFLFDTLNIIMFSIGFATLLFSANGLKSSLQWISCRLKFHPVIISIFILGINPQIAILSTTAAVYQLPYLSMGSIIGNAIVALTLSLALPLILFREDPYLKLMAENVQKNERIQSTSLYFVLLSMTCIVISLVAIPSMASFSYNLLLIGLINIHIFSAFVIQNFLKFQQSQTVLYIESKVDAEPVLKEQEIESTDQFCDDSDYGDFDEECGGNFYDNAYDDYANIDCGDDDVMTVQMVDLSKHSPLTVQDIVSVKMSELSEFEQKASPKFLSAFCYGLLCLFSSWFCIDSVSQLAENGTFMGYIIISLLTNIDTVTYTLKMYKEERPSGYTLRIGKLLASMMWNIGFVLAVCGVFLQGMTFRLVDRINVVLLFGSAVYVSLIIRYYMFKRAHGIGLLSIFGVYLFVNMTIGEIEG